LLAALLLCQGCSKGAGAKKPQPPPPVTVVLAEEGEMPLVYDTYGLVEPFKQISVKSKLTGKIMELGFAPGQRIAKGGLLVKLDDREYEANLKIYQAQLRKNQILSEDAKRILEMKEQLLQSSAVTKTETATQRATAESAIAALEADKAGIDVTRLNIEYCNILAPFDGVAGDILIHANSIVKANDDTITKFVQVKPVYVAFSLPERMLPSVRKIRSEGKQLEILVKIPSDKECPGLKGELTFIDNIVDAASGTVKMKATFANDAERLWPGEYVDVAVELSKDERFVSVPTEAVMSGQEGQQVFVLKGDETVELRPVRPLRSYGGRTAVTGVKAGEKVVLTGQFRLAPNMKVSVKEAPKAGQAKAEN
jgi:multidrug efflux system membrane fusion protein